MEEGKSSSIVARPSQRAFPQRLLQLLVFSFLLCLTCGIVSVYMIRFFGDTTSANPTFLPYRSADILSLKEWIAPPRNLMHRMSDEQLFWRASFEPRVKRYPYNRVPKIAFMFLTKGPLPLAPLWERFFKGHGEQYSIYIHSSPSFQPKFTSSSVFYKRQIPSKVTEWGKMSMCDAERRLLANALLDLANERFVLLSESCIPLLNFSTIYSYIIGSKYSFMSVFDDPGPHGRGRYSSNMLPEVRITQWRKGSQWFEVKRKLAVLIIQDQKFYPKFSEFCKPACYVDEHYFPTMLSIEAGQMLANRSLTWVDWSRGGSHPAMFGGSDISEDLMRRIQEKNECIYNDVPASVCFLFARKFSHSALDALLLLPPSFLGF